MKKTIIFSILASALLIGCGGGGDDDSSSSNNGGTNDSFESETITHNSFEYKTIQSPITGEIWLDRNLGASSVCTQSYDEFNSYSEYKTSQVSCFGGYYQWGRLTDGHQLIDSNSTTTKALDVVGLDDKFIATSQFTDRDWVDDGVDDDYSLRLAQWQNTTSSNMCPSGFRVPTSDELSAETVSYSGSNDITSGQVKTTDTQSAFDNFLRLPISGTKTFNSLLTSNTTVGLWTTTTMGDDQATYINYLNASVGFMTNLNYGINVRCIKD